MKHLILTPALLEVLPEEYRAVLIATADSQAAAGTPPADPSRKTPNLTQPLKSYSDADLSQYSTFEELENHLIESGLPTVGLEHMKLLNRLADLLAKK